MPSYVSRLHVHFVYVSLVADNILLDNISHIVATIGVTLRAVQDVETTKAQLVPIRVIYNRLSGRSDVRPSVISMWRSLVPRGHEMIGADKACEAVGAAWQLCSGCNSQLYYSRECQKL